MTEPLVDFSTLRTDLARGVADLGWTQPMAVQARVIPIMRKGADVIVQAITGSGKTGAFGLPILEAIDLDRRALQALVLAPTRELASQIQVEIAAMGKHIGVDTAAIYGGTAYGPQIEAIDRGAQVITGTPGRLLDHLKSGRLKLDEVRILIFDEADELLSLGFWPDIKEIRTYMPRERQTGLFSATIPERVRSLARQFMTEPEFVSLTEGGVRSPEEIEHYHYIVSAQEKEAMLVRVLDYEEPESGIIFANTRADVRYVSRYLQRRGFDADMIQGEMSQAAREQVMARIKAGALRFLVATDVAARGIDISDLSHVISYSTPEQPEVYLHRTGRTGRAGKTGTAISLVSGLDIGDWKHLQAVHRMVIPERPLPTEKDVAARVALRIQNRVEHDLRELPEGEQRARRQAYLAIVEQLGATDEGRGLLSAIMYAYAHGGAQAARPAEASPALASVSPLAAAAEPRDGVRKRKRRRGRRGS